MWKVEYCTSGTSKTAKTTVETEEALRLWVAGVDQERGIPTMAIFTARFQMHKANYRQWGTDYWWLSMEEIGEIES